MARGAVLEHSEHALHLLGEPVEGPLDPKLILRPMTRDDTPAITGLLATGFGWRPSNEADAADMLSRLEGDVLVGELDDIIVATLRIHIDLPAAISRVRLARSSRRSGMWL
jgi:hypothetical protein